MHAEDWQVHPGALGPGTEVGSWRVVERLGVGGYGAVYRVEDLSLPGDFYALKLTLRHGDERAEREVHLLMSRGVHPNVVRLHACGRWPHPRTGYLYFVMDWVPGLALHTWVETVNPSFRLLAEKVGKVALALGSLHGRGVLHRDFKPEHVVIREGDGEPVLLDFGVGRYAGAETVTTAVLPPATVHLLSPEAVHFFRAHYKRPGARYEARATDDLYALGVSLYRVVTGDWPFSPELPPDLLYLQIEAGLPAAPRVVNRRAPRSLSDIIMRLLSKKPGERFQSGHEVHAALVAAVALDGPGRWELPVFELEDGPDAGGAVRRIRRPGATTAARTPPRRKLVLGPFLPLPRLGARRSRAVPRSVRRPESRRRVGGYVAALLAALACVVWAGRGAGGRWLTPRSEESPAGAQATMEGRLTGSSGHEVAREVESPDTSAAAAPRLDSTPAAVAAPATHAEDPAPVKKKTAVPPSTPAMQQKAPGLGAMGKALCVGATSAALACSGTEVRPVRPARPAPESCPPGAVETMEKLGLRYGRTNTVTWTGERELITVREGATSMRMVADWGALPDGTRFFGKLIFAEARVYGRFTEAQTPGGDRFPVCMQLLDTGDREGLEREGEAGPDATRVFAVGQLEVVESFE